MKRVVALLFCKDLAGARERETIGFAIVSAVAGWWLSQCRKTPKIKGVRALLLGKLCFSPITPKLTRRTVCIAFKEPAKKTGIFIADSVTDFIDTHNAMLK